MQIKTVCCVGAGFVGGTFCSVAAFKCPDVQFHVIGQNEEVIQQWNSNRLPLFEPELDEIVRNCRGKNLSFTTDTALLKDADAIFICSEGTEMCQRAEEMKALEDAARLIIDTVDSSKMIVEKSMIAIEASEAVSNILKAYEESYKSFTLVANPEFIAEGNAVNKLLNPERVLIGSDGTMRTASAVEALVSFYEHWVPRSKIITSDLWSVELLNLAEAAFVAQSITSINSIAEICEELEIDLSEVAQAVSMDRRIGVPNLGEFIGFREASYLKSLESIIYLSKCLNLPKITRYWEKLLDESNNQRRKFTAKIINTFRSNLIDTRLAVLGFALSKETSGTHNSVAVNVSKDLLQAGAKLKICDAVVSAKVIENELAADLPSPLREKVSEVVEVFDDPYKAASGAQAIILCTNWPQLAELDFSKLFNVMKKPAYVFDGNNVLPHEKLRQIGFYVQTLATQLPKTKFLENFN